MKKITLLFILLIFGKVGAQVGIIQSFPNTTTPTGWDVGDGGISTSEACATASWRGNVYNSTPKILTSETQISNGQDLTISFDYKIVNWFEATVATDPFDGTITTEVSIDNGATWTVTAGVVNNVNHLIGNTCRTVSYVVPGASVPNASNVKVRWNCVFGTSGDYYVYIDNISATQPTSTPPLCTSITSPVSGAIDVANPLVVWNSASGIPTGYRLNVGINPGGTDVLNNFDVGNVLSYYLSNLEGGTTYYVTVFPYNANGQATGCTEINFTTCDVFTIPFTEEFESITSGVPSCWGIAGTTTNSAYHFSSFATGNTGKGLRFDSWSNSNGNTSELTTPVIDASSVSSLRLKFYYKNPTGGNFEVLVSSDGGSTYTSLESGLTGTANWTLKSYVLTSYIGADLKVKFKGTSNYGSGDAYIYLDGVVLEEIPVTLPSCVAITSPTNGAINVSNSTVTWLANVDATGYRISVGTSSGATDVLNNFDVGNVLSYYLTNLVGGSTYYVTVYPYNGFGQATGCTESNFTTCDELGDFVENFDGLSTTGLIPDCWSRVLSDGVSTFASVGSDTDNFTAPYSIELYNSNSPATSNIMLVTPFINNLSAGTNRLRFVARNSTDSEDVIVGTMSNPSDASTFTPLETVDINGTFAQYIVDFTGYTGTDDYIAIKRLSTSTYTYVYIDNFVWEALPLTAPICATNVIATPNATCGNFANSITWDAVSGADGYYISVGTTSGGTQVANNVDLGNVLNYSFSGDLNTTYFYTITPYNWVGSATGCTELSFTTNANGCYCDSVPTSNDNDGITNVQIGSTNFPTGDVMYFDHTATVVDLAQGINANVQVTFATEYDYHTNVWIDFNDNYTFESSELVYQGQSSDASPTTLNASFVMPATAALGQHRMRIGTADYGQEIPDPCYSGAYGVTLDFIVNIVTASCTPPAATTTLVPACGASQYSIDVNVTALGSGTPSITDGTSSWPVSAIGVVNVGPFASGSSVNLTLLHGSDTTCNLPLGNFVYNCPATNDDLCNAIPLVVNAISTGTQYNNIGATSETNEPIASCFEDGINGSVWFSFVAPASGEVIITTDIAGASATDTEIALYNATGVTCSDLSTLGAPIGCDQDGGTTIIYNSILVQAGLTPGTTYYIQVDDYGYGTDQGTFGIEVQEVLSSDLFDNNNFMAYPNPVKDVLNVSYSTEISSIRVINMIGQEVISKNINATSTQVDMSELSAGTYIVNVTVGDSVKTLKVVKQ